MIQLSDIERNINPNSRLWVYQFKKHLSEEQLVEINSDLNQFTANWESHGKKLDATSLILQSHFIIIAVNESTFEASGCSIDKSIAILKQINAKFELDLFNRLNVALYKNNDFSFYSSAEVLDEVAKGAISSEELFLDISISNSKELPLILKPINQSWFYKRLKHA